MRARPLKYSTKEEKYLTVGGLVPQLLDIFQAIKGDITSRLRFLLPMGYQWERKWGISLLGDAARLMTSTFLAGDDLDLLSEDLFRLSEAIAIAVVKTGGDRLV